MKINILRNTIAWFGKYSGYEALTEFFPQNLRLTITQPNDKVFSRVVGKLFKVFKGWDRVKPSEIFAGLQFVRKIRNNDISHILYLEGHLHIVGTLKNSHRRNKLVGTIHLPISKWDDAGLAALSNLGHVIILFQEGVDQFSRYIDRTRIHVIKHGVNIDFFQPGNKASIERNKILFVGHYMRNFEMFAAVYEAIQSDIDGNFQFHFIIPSYHRNSGPIQNIAKLINVFFHEGLSDEQMLKFYQTSYLMLMPMDDSGANTAIVQAIATGLPVITTDVGGIRTYGGGEIFPVVENNAVTSMVELFKKYHFDESFRNSISENQRQFAIEHLAWNLIAEQHTLVYESVLRRDK